VGWKSLSRNTSPTSDVSASSSYPLRNRGARSRHPRARLRRLQAPRIRYA
jgi:hypothetical protein